MGDGKFMTLMFGLQTVNAIKVSIAKFELLKQVFRGLSVGYKGVALALVMELWKVIGLTV